MKPLDYALIIAALTFVTFAATYASAKPGKHIQPAQSAHGDCMDSMRKAYGGYWPSNAVLNAADHACQH